MEANIYRWYKWLGVDVEYEPRWFRFPGVDSPPWGYVPDLKLNIGKEAYYLEIKGRTSQESILKLVRMKKYYPEIRVLWIGEYEYNWISKYYKNKVPNWE